MYGQQQGMNPMFPGAGGPPMGTPQATAYPGSYGGGMGTQYGGGGMSAAKDHDNPKGNRDALAIAIRWLKTRNDREKTLMGVAAGILVLFLLWVVIEDHDFLFVMAEVCHFIGIGLLSYKLLKKKSCVVIIM